MIIIDKLCYQSGLRYVNAGEKFVYAVLTLVFCIMSRSLVMAAAVFLINGILTVGKGGIPLSRYVRLLLIPAVFLLIGTAAVFVNISETALDAFAFPVGKWYITGSQASIRQGIRVCATAFAAVSCLYFLSLNTTMTDILTVLKKMRLPSFLIELMLLIYRFIFLLMETASAIRVSQDSRLGNRDLRTGLRSFGVMGTALFIRALKRSGTLYDAMEARGYDGTIRVLSSEQPPKKREIIYIACFEMILFLAAIWSIIK